MRAPVLILIAALALPGAALAGKGDRAAQRDPERAERRAKVMEKIEIIRIERLTDALQLDPKSAEKLFPVLRPFEQRRRDAHGRRFDALRELRTQIESGHPDEKIVAEELDGLMEASREVATIADEEYAALKPVLDPVTLAKYYRFQVEFERKIGDLIREIKGETEKVPGSADPGRPPSKPGKDRIR